MLILFSLAHATSEPDTGCSLLSSLPAEGEPEAPLDLIPLVTVEGGGCDAFTEARIRHGYADAFTSVPIDLGIRSLDEVPYRDWVPGPTQIELWSPDHSLTIDFTVVDRVAEVLPAPTFQGLTARALSDAPGRAELILSLDTPEGTAVVYFDEADTTVEPFPIAIQPFYETTVDDDQGQVCMVARVRGLGGTWSESTTACTEVLPAVETGNTDDSTPQPGCSTAPSVTLPSLFRR